MKKRLQKRKGGRFKGWQWVVREFAIGVFLLEAIFGLSKDL
jgi:hypothetical protein